MNPLIILKVLDRVWPSQAAALGMHLFLRPQRYPRPPEEEKLWSRAEKLTVPSGRAWRRFGNPGGPRVIFLHGWESRGSVFHKWFDPFVAAGFEVLAWDGPAQGDSPGTSTNLFDYTRSLAEDLRFLGSEPDILIGHSFGGASALLSQLLGLLHPRFSVVIGAPGRVSGVIDRMAENYGFSPKTRGHFERSLEKVAGVPISTGDFIRRAQELPRELLIVHDRLDKEVPFEESRLLAEASGAEFIPTEGLGHRRILHDADLIRRILDITRARLSQ